MIPPPREEAGGGAKTTGVGSRATPPFATAFALAPDDVLASRTDCAGLPHPLGRQEEGGRATPTTTSPILSAVAAEATAAARCVTFRAPPAVFWIPCGFWGGLGFRMLDVCRAIDGLLT
jgi:hypothetical protein